MTLSIMDNHDAIKTALKDYQTATGEIPKVLERYLEYVARTGKPLFSWDLISCLVMKKFENVLEDFALEKPLQCIKNVNGDNLTTQDLKQECILALTSLNGVPFTIQRVCELLLNPKKNYSKLDKFLRGFLRVIKVVTTVDRIGQKITTESQLFANAMSPFPINECGDNFSGFSSQSEDSMVNIQMHSPTDNFSSKTELDYTIEDKVSQPTTTCLPADSMDSFTTKMIDQEQQTSENIYHTDQYFLEQKTISMPPIGALFKPIDQLEAFVQNVSNQVESSTSNIEDIKKRSANDSVDFMINDKNLSSSPSDIQEYGSPAKKRKFDHESQDAVISSSDISETGHQIIPNDQNDLETEAIPTMSSQVLVCAEEPSSTNELKNNLDQEPMQETLQNTGFAVEPGNSSNQSVEADQSNCDDIDQQNSQTNEQDESLSSSSFEKESNSIDEETGEHV